MSGADFYAISNKTRQHALKRLINVYEKSETNEFNEENDCFNEVVLNDQDFNAALVEFQPTLNEAAMTSYEKYFNSFSNKQ